MEIGCRKLDEIKNICNEEGRRKSLETGYLVEIEIEKDVQMGSKFQLTWKYQLVENGNFKTYGTLLLCVTSKKTL